MWVHVLPRLRSPTPNVHAKLAKNVKNSTDRAFKLTSFSKNLWANHQTTHKIIIIFIV